MNDLIATKMLKLNVGRVEGQLAVGYLGKELVGSRVLKATPEKLVCLIEEIDDSITLSTIDINAEPMMQNVVLDVEVLKALNSYLNS